MYDQTPGVFIRVKAMSGGRRSIQVCESRRQGRKVTQHIIRHVGIAMDDQEEEMVRSMAELILVKEQLARSESGALFSAKVIAQGRRSKKRNEGILPCSEVTEVTESSVESTQISGLEVDLGHIEEQARHVEGIGEVFGSLFDELGLNQIVQGVHAPVLKSTVLARIAEPCSKRQTQDLLEKDYGQSYPLDSLYRMMDALEQRKERAQKLVRFSTLELVGHHLDVCFFDVTTLYFESIEEDELRGFGYSKDQKFHQVQVVLALLTTQQGLPVGYKLFPGSTAEVSTLVACVKEWQQDAVLGQITVVADRGMMSDKNLKELEAAGFQYIVGASLKKLKEPLKKKVLEERDDHLHALESDAVWIKTLDLPEGRRLVSTFSSKRAHKDIADRQRLLDSLQKRIGKKTKAPLKKLVSNRGYLQYTMTEGQAVVSLDEDKIARDAQWDGMYGILTNVPGMSAQDALYRYRQLWTIEEAFRISKHDLQMRPIFHFKKRRIEAHILLCFLAYALTRHAQHRLQRHAIHLSVDRLRKELSQVQSSILHDKLTGRRFRLPSTLSPVVTSIYQAFQLSRSLTPSLLS